MRESMSCVGALASHAIRHPGQLVQAVRSLHNHLDRSGSLIA